MCHMNIEKIYNIGIIGETDKKMPAEQSLCLARKSFMHI